MLAESHAHKSQENTTDVFLGPLLPTPEDRRALRLHRRRGRVYKYPMRQIGIGLIALATSVVARQSCGPSYLYSLYYREVSGVKSHETRKETL